MNSSIYTQRNLAHIGYHLVKKMPDVAEQIISAAPLPPGQSKDFSRITEYFYQYCCIIKIPVEDMLLIRNSYNITEKRRQFVGVVLRIYYPELFLNKAAYFGGRRGLIKQLAQSMGIQGSNTSTMVDKVHGWIWAYPDWTEQVLAIYDQLKTKLNGSIS